MTSKTFLPIFLAAALSLPTAIWAAQSAVSPVVGGGALVHAVSETKTETPMVGLANPAATFCVESGGQYQIHTAADGGQSGTCTLADGTEMDAWEYFRENAPKTDGSD